MFETQSSLNSLHVKISELVQKYKDLSAENESLRQEVVRVKAQGEAKDVQIAKLEEDLRKKDMESDDIISKIEAVLGR
ncbi:MAG: hypothetical protein PHN38_06640 [Sulfurospirillaceae bacterium]|nr:hypothetical protein [Sulfurospirillaceae bacterium]MDD3463251.1 hypothetical protein [Sulfurospirillaceae bacterium]